MATVLTKCIVIDGRLLILVLRAAERLLRGRAHIRHLCRLRDSWLPATEPGQPNNMVKR